MYQVIQCHQDEIISLFAQLVSNIFILLQCDHLPCALVSKYILDLQPFFSQPLTFFAVQLLPKVGSTRVLERFIIFFISNVVFFTQKEQSNFLSPHPCNEAYVDMYTWQFNYRLYSRCVPHSKHFQKNKCSHIVLCKIFIKYGFQMRVFGENPQKRLVQH